MSASWGGEEQDADEVKFKDTEEVKWRHAGGMTQSPKGCMLPDVRQRAEEVKKTMWYLGKKGRPTACDIMISFFKKPLMVEGPIEDGEMTRHLQTVSI